MKNCENNKDLYIKNLSKEELISLVLKLKNTIDDNKEVIQQKDKIISEKDTIIEKQNDLIKQNEDELKKLNIEVKNLKAQLNKINVERFVTKDDNAFRDQAARKQISREKLKDNKESKKRGRHIGSKNYSKENLELLSAENDVIINDNIDKLKQEHPNWQFIKLENSSDISYVIEREKVKIKVFKVITPKYIAKDLATKKRIDGIFQAPSKSIINHSYAGASLLADLITMKYNYGLPFYRYNDWLSTCGFNVEERTIYKWAMKSASLLEGVYDQIGRELLEGDCKCIGVDETYLKVIDNIKENRENNYVYLLSSEHDNKEFHFYKYTKTRESDWIKSYLKNYKGSIVVDGYSGYKSLPGQISKQRCLAHLRRKLTDILKTLKQDKRKESASYRLVTELDKVFHLENKIREQTNNPLEILRLRNEEEYQNALKTFDDDIRSINAADGTKLKEAQDYYLNDRDSFMTFNDNGYVPLTNNQTERLAKDFATNRRSFLFCKSDEGAKVCAILTTLAKTAIANGLYIDAYLEYVLRHVQDTKVEELTPWALKNKEGLKISRG